MVVLILKHPFLKTEPTLKRNKEIQYQEKLENFQKARNFRTHELEILGVPLGQSTNSSEKKGKTHLILEISSVATISILYFSLVPFSTKI